MKAIGVGLALALACSGATWAAADDTNRAMGWVAPKLEALKDQWPRDANGGLIYGWAALDCGVAAGHADSCTVKHSEPANPKLEQAALALSSLYTTKDTSKPRRPLVVSVEFDNAPDWLKKPNFDQLLAVFPTKAKGKEGGATITCTVKTDGLLRACRIVNESPPGLGFGPAALILAPTFLMKPALRAGRPVETEISIPIKFEGQGYSGPGPEIRVVSVPAWAKTPTVPEILAELDKKVGDRFADGKVTFQCTVSKKTGGLSDCIPITVGPGMAGFKGAAQALTSKFAVDKQFLSDLKQEVRVNLAFSFPDMQSEAWSKRYLLHPVWLKTVSPDPNQPLFPDEAAKAGLKSGSATVDCVLAPGGALTGCEVISESTPGMGFGELAVKVAEVFVANPWTEDGLPADGAHVRMPIRMNYDPSRDAPPPEVPTPATKP